MTPNDRRKLATALRIGCVRTRRVAGIEELTHIGGTETDGTPWSAPVEAVIEAIGDGQAYYVLTPAESLLILVYVDASGKKRLKAGFHEDDSSLLRLARCP
jgi:hypothetical protein